MSKQILLADYKVPDFLMNRVELDIDIQPKEAIVSSRLEVHRNPKAKGKSAPLVLDGSNQKLLEVKVDGKVLAAKEYTLTDVALTIKDIGRKAVVEIKSSHDPYNNTALFGLYKAGPMLNTQCEPNGFRRITYYPDRPDVMGKFRVTIHADKKKYPVLLANGNLLATGHEPKGRHFAVWEDPFPKPAYLFAMVAGPLDKVASTFRTKSGRKVLIEIYVEKGKTKDTEFAMTAIKKAMKWDEQAFGLEYDLDRFMIVGTPFFNMGAMENKGLNIFNDSCLLGRVDTASDATISFIERVVGHEYFHNWTGDRITCRDWFQLSLKEGLTVFREQEFMGAMNSVAVERLDNVRALRRIQFAEDAGTMAHPVRPDRYEEIDNFYTATVYEKGSEVVRMLQTLVGGPKNFRKGMNLYVKRHDGQAVTCEDFAQAIYDANKSKFDLKQFLLWYKQAGTPVLDVTSKYDEKAKALRLTVKQKVPPTPGQKKKQPMLIPLAIGLLDEKGRDMTETQVLQVKKPSQEFIIKGVKSKPVLSLLRDFSAPVIVNYKQSDGELLFLMANDSDHFNRWEAGYRLATKYLLEMAAGKKPPVERLIDALGAVLRNSKIDASFKSMLLLVPTEGELGLAQRAQGKTITLDSLYEARKALVRRIGAELKNELKQCLDALKNLPVSATDGVSMGKRSLKNLCLSYLCMSEDKAMLERAYKQAVTPRNMTDQVAALGILSDKDTPLRAKAFAAFEKKWGKLPTVMDSWFSLQASAKRKDVLADVKRLVKHKAFDIKNPNRISALFRSFAGSVLGFHAADGSGYKFIADMIIKIDSYNPHSSAGLAKAFTRWRDYDAKRQKLMKAQLKRIASVKKLSPNVKEIVGKSLV